MTERLTDKEVKHLFSILDEPVKKTPHEKEMIRNLKKGLELVRSLQPKPKIGYMGTSGDPMSDHDY